MMCLPGEWWRGGTSKALIVAASDLPEDPGLRDGILLRAFGSPDPTGRQLDGIGGGTSSTSKVAVVRASDEQGVDVDYLFLQVGIETARVDSAGMCGNIASAIGPYAVDAGLVRIDGDSEAAVTIRNVNTGMLIRSRFAVADGRHVVTGALAIDGVPKPGSRIDLDFLDVGGAVTGQLFPTGARTDVIESRGVDLRVTVIDAANPLIFLVESELGLTRGHEIAPDSLARIEEVRQVVAARIGLDPAGVLPRVAIVESPSDYRASTGSLIAAADHDVRVRAISAGRVHGSFPLTSAIATAVAARMPETVVFRLATPTSLHTRIGHPSGVVTVEAHIDQTDERPTSIRVRMSRTARRLMSGLVDVPDVSPQPGVASTHERQERRKPK